MHITTGQGVARPNGTLIDTPDLAGWLATASSSGDTERWWSPHRWVGERRSSRGWLGASAVCVDLDLRNGRDKVPSDPYADALLDAWESARLPGSVFHLTPHGVRVVFLLDAPCTDAAAYRRAVEGATHECAEVVRAVLGSEVDVHEDVAAMADLARLIWMPATTDEKGRSRSAKVYVREGDDDPDDPPVYTVAHLAACAPAKAPPPPPPADRPARTVEAVAEFEEARDRFNRDTDPARIREIGYPYQDVPARRCPVCNHEGCFGPLQGPDGPQAGRWVCYSTNHAEDAPGGAVVGTPMRDGGHTGDTLDLVAFFAGTPPTAVLINAGYLEPRMAPPPPPPADGTTVVRIPRADPFHKDAGEFAEEVFAAVPFGTWYRFSGVVGALRRVNGRLGHATLKASAIALDAARYVEFRDVRVSKKGEAKEVRVNAGRYEGQVLLDAGATHARIPDLEGVYTHPVVAGREYREIRPGYNPAVRLYYDEPDALRGLRPAMDDTPATAFETLTAYLEDFTDVLPPCGIANVVGLMVTTLVRPALRGHPVPLHFASSTIEGTGKSLILEEFVGSCITGRQPVNVHVGANEDETAKTLFAYARSGATMIVLDNIRGGDQLDDAQLASAITRPTLAARVLGVSEMREIPNMFVPMGTGNNVTFSPELARRIVPIAFAPDVDPRTRTFVHTDARAWVREARRMVLECILGAVERWRVAGCPAHPSGRRLVGFEEWSRVVGGIVGVLGFDPWLENVDEWQRGEANPQVMAMRSLCAAWWGRDDMRYVPQKAKDLYELVSDAPEALGVHGSTELGRLQQFGRRLREMHGRPDLTPYRVHGSLRSGSWSYTIDRTDTPTE